MTDEKVLSISERYIELYEKVIGEKFIKPSESNPEERILQNILKAL